jgi:hypothetical protein
MPRAHAMSFSLADELMPTYDVAMCHALTVAAPASAVWDALHHADFAGAWYVRALLILRGLRRLHDPQRLTLDRVIAGAFVPLAERPGHELALGIAGRFWAPSGGRVEVTPDEFRRFARPGHAKALWTFSLVDVAPAQTRLQTETRIACADAASRRRFRIYWLIVGPFAGLIRKAMLVAVAAEATAPSPTRPV